MFTNRVRQTIAAMLQGLPLMATVEDFDPPAISMKTEEMVGGRFIGEEMAIGMNALTAKLKLQGAGLPIVTALGVGAGDTVMLTVQEAGIDQEGNEWFTYHICSGQLKEFSDETVKMGNKPITTLELMLRSYQRLENGVPVTDIDTRTQKVVINGVDMLKGSRRNALMV